MRRAAVIGVGALALSGLTVSAWAAPIYEGKYVGNTDDKGELVTVVTARKDDGKLYVTKFKVNQGEECGVTVYTHATHPTVMPVRVKTVEGEKVFKIVDEPLPGVIAFKVKGTWETSNVVSGSYTQIACDGDGDVWGAAGGGPA